MLEVIAYDDREIKLNGKKVVSDDGGTFRATHRMLDRLGKDIEIKESRVGDFQVYSALGGRFSAMCISIRRTRSCTRPSSAK